MTENARSRERARDENKEESKSRTRTKVRLHNTIITLPIEKWIDYSLSQGKETSRDDDTRFLPVVEAEIEL